MNVRSPRTWDDVFLEDEHFGPRFGELRCRRETAHSAPHNDRIVHNIYVFRRGSWVRVRVGIIHDEK